MRRVLTVYMILFACAFVGAAMLEKTPFALSQYMPLERTTAWFEEKPVCIGEQAEDYWCWEAYFSEVAKKNPRTALKKLRAEALAHTYPGDECHALLHSIGKVSAEYYGNIADAFVHGDPFCQSGYYHGVLIGIFSETGGERLLSTIDMICESIQGKHRYSREYFLCVHGIGHGLMTYFDRNLSESIAACETLTGVWEQQACSGGVFMENVMSADETAYRDPRDLSYPCTTVPEQFQYNCHLYHAPYVWSQLGDTQSVLAHCDSLGESLRFACYQGLGGSVIDEEYDAAHVRAECARGNSHEAVVQCLLGAGHEFLVYYHSLARAQELCVAAGAYERYCKESLARMYRDF